MGDRVHFTPTPQPEMAGHSTHSARGWKMSFALIFTTVLALVLLVAMNREEHDAILPETKFETTQSGFDEAVFDDSDAFLELQRKASNTLRNVIDLKGFCIAAFDKAVEMRLAHAKARGPLVDFIIAFGKVRHDAGKHNVFAGNVIVEYSKAMGKTKATYKHGIGKYLLHHVDKAVIAGNGIVTTVMLKHHTMMMLNYKALGFKAAFEPHYFRRTAVTISQYMRYQTQVDKVSKGADADAAAVWLRTGAHDHYKSFMAKVVAKYRAAKKKYIGKIVKGALNAERRAFKGNRKGPTGGVHPMAPAGILGGATIRKKLQAFKYPSEKKLKAEARAAGSAWYAEKKHKGVDAKKAIENMEKKAMKKKLEKKAKAKAKRDAAKKKIADEKKAKGDRKTKASKKKSAEKKKNKDKKVAAEKDRKARAARIKADEKDKKKKIKEATVERDFKKAHKEKVNKAKGLVAKAKRDEALKKLSLKKAKEEAWYAEKKKKGVDAKTAI